MQRLLAFILLLLLLPILLLTALLVALFDGMPVIFTQERLGLNRQVFTIYKFRTMRKERITFLGRVLRKTGLDELPQLINILEGRMRFVGPRPLTQQDIERLEWTDACFDPRWSEVPGLTGMAQLSPVCDKDISLANDLYYVTHRSFSLDARIVFQSLLVPFIGKNKTKNLIHK